MLRWERLGSRAVGDRSTTAVDPAVGEGLEEPLPASLTGVRSAARGDADAPAEVCAAWPGPAADPGWTPEQPVISTDARIPAADSRRVA